ncbi:MAG: hypothetical protein M0P58_13110 [Bacteroidales bacterium]|nr:hypothetical protein [Bacteroidales bacterium]
MRKPNIFFYILFLLIAFRVEAQVSTFSKQYIDTLKQGRPTSSRSSAVTKEPHYTINRRISEPRILASP